MSARAFRPDGQAVTLVATSTSSRQPLVNGGGTCASETFAVTVEAGGSVVYVTTGTSTITATASDQVAATYCSNPVLPGTTRVFELKNSNHTHVAVITRTGTSYVYVQPGVGGL